MKQPGKRAGTERTDLGGRPRRERTKLRKRPGTERTDLGGRPRRERTKLRKRPGKESKQLRTRPGGEKAKREAGDREERMLTLMSNMKLEAAAAAQKQTKRS